MTWPLLLRCKFAMAPPPAACRAALPFECLLATEPAAVGNNLASRSATYRNRACDPDLPLARTWRGCATLLDTFQATVEVRGGRGCGCVARRGALGHRSSTTAVLVVQGILTPQLAQVSVRKIYARGRELRKKRSLQASLPYTTRNRRYQLVSPAGHGMAAVAASGLQRSVALQTAACTWAGS